MADYQLKKLCVNEGYVTEVKKLLRDHFEFESKDAVELAIQEWIENHEYKIWRECLRVIDSTKKRNNRMWKYVLGMLHSGGDVVFITFTFNNESLSESTFADRRRWVRNFLHNQCDYYIANVDFGDKSKNIESEEREHYHAVAVGRVNMDLWKYGWMFAEQVKKRGELPKDIATSKKLCKYVSKLTEHAMKNSTGNFRLIYSRNCKNLLKYTSSAEK